MTEIRRDQVWASADAYEPYVGRWSRLVAREFLEWIGVSSGKSWLDVGCGTGAVSQAILQVASPALVKGIDPSSAYVEYARARTNDPRASFETGDAQKLPFDDATFDAVVSGLVLNFVPDANQAAKEMVRVSRRNGIVAAYVWDYAGEMQLMRHFWNAACELDPKASHLDERVRFRICQPAPLMNLLRGVGLKNVKTHAIDVPTAFRDFDDCWSLFLGGQGAAGGYAMSLSEGRRAALREHIQGRLPIRPDGSIQLIARAWSVRGEN